MIFSTVFGPQEPAFTVGSLAIRATGRPATVAMPVTTPSAPKPSCSQFASSASSTNESGSTSRATLRAQRAADQLNAAAPDGVANRGTEEAHPHRCEQCRAEREQADPQPD